MKSTLTIVPPRLPSVVSQQPLTPVAVRRDDVLDLLTRGAQIVEVLSPAEYADAHLPGAVNIPLPQLDRASTAQLDQLRPVIVYCAAAESDLSARAAWRLVSLGFREVFRYTRGKVDWLANGLPFEGAVSQAASAASLARPDVPTCRPHDRLEQLQTILEDDRWPTCVVVNDQRVVFGTLGRADLDGDPRTTAEHRMHAGPPTVRGNAELPRLAEALSAAGLDSVLVTNSGGQLVGLLCYDDLEHHLQSTTASARPGPAASGR